MWDRWTVGESWEWVRGKGNDMIDTEQKHESPATTNENSVLEKIGSRLGLEPGELSQLVSLAVKDAATEALWRGGPIWGPETKSYEDDNQVDVPHGELTISASCQQRLLAARELYGIVDARGYENLKRTERVLHANLRRIDRSEASPDGTVQ